MVRGCEATELAEWCSLTSWCAVRAWGL